MASKVLRSGIMVRLQSFALTAVPELIRLTWRCTRRPLSTMSSRNKVPYHGRLSEERFHFVLDHPIRPRYPLVVAQMLKPGLVKECFHVQTRIGGVLKQFPANGSVPQPSLPQRLNGIEEIRPALRVDSVLYRHQHRAMLQLDAGYRRHVRPVA